MATETFEYQSEFTRALEARGEARGRAAMILQILTTTRGLPVTDDGRERILSCTDLDQLQSWGTRALTAGSIEDLFA